MTLPNQDQNGELEDNGDIDEPLGCVCANTTVAEECNAG